MMKKILMFILFIANQIYSQSLTVTGTWTSTLATSNITEAGLDYSSSYNIMSSVSQSLMTVNSAKNSVAFVYVQKSDTSWDTRLILSVLRTGSGTGNNNFLVTNGTTSQIVSNVPQYFFEVRPAGGTRVSNIPIQYKISGFTVLLPVKSYTTTLLYTVTN